MYGQSVKYLSPENRLVCVDCCHNCIMAWYRPDHVISDRFMKSTSNAAFSDSGIMDSYITDQTL